VLKKILLVLGLILLVGCSSSSYEMCFDDCAKVNCDWNHVIRPSASTKADNHCPTTEITIREFCYEECKNS